MGTISNCLHLFVNLKKKKYFYVNSTTQRCPNIIFKTFLIDYFFHLPPVSKLSTTLVVHFRKIENGPNGILTGFGETGSWKKKLDVENLVALSLWLHGQWRARIYSRTMFLTQLWPFVSFMAFRCCIALCSAHLRAENIYIHDIIVFQSTVLVFQIAEEEVWKSLIYCNEKQYCGAGG